MGDETCGKTCPANGEEVCSPMMHRLIELIELGFSNQKQIGHSLHDVSNTQGIIKEMVNRFDRQDEKIGLLKDRDRASNAAISELYGALGVMEKQPLARMKRKIKGMAKWSGILLGVTVLNKIFEHLEWFQQIKSVVIVMLQGW